MATAFAVAHATASAMATEDDPGEDAGHQFSDRDLADADADREPADDQRLGLGADRIGEVDDPGYKQGQGQVGAEPFLEPTHQPCRSQRTDQPDQQPRQSVQESASDRFTAGVFRGTGRGQEPAQPCDVLIVLAQQHPQEAIRRYDAGESTIVVDQHEAALALHDRVPHRDLFVGARCHRRGIGVHQFGDGHVVVRGDQGLDPDDSHHACALFSVTPASVRHPGQMDVPERETGRHRRPLMASGDAAPPRRY
jgi:hypothetical protein